MNTPLERVLNALEVMTGYAPRKTGSGWRVTCPVCGTAALKGSIAEVANGTVLAHWFCGHEIADVMAALGLTLADLYDRRDLRTLTPTERRTLRDTWRTVAWRAALPVLTEEASVLLIAANEMGDLLDGKPVDAARVRRAALHVFEAWEVLRG